jgi:4-phytase / acid phosphatase
MRPNRLQRDHCVMKEKHVSVRWGAAICLLAQICFASAQSAPKAENPTRTAGQLKFVLVLTRHGVRSPTWTNARLDQYAKQPWPRWPVEPGVLTPHGKQLMTYFGAYYRAYFAQLGLLSSEGCVDVSQVYFWADTDQRTRESARGLADGMFPGCPEPVHALPGATRDELFHPAVETSVRATEYAALAGRIGNAPAALLAAHRMPLEAMHRVLNDCPADPCDSGGRTNLLTLEPSLMAGGEGQSVQLKIPLTTAATFAENLQLEYLEGMPADAVGWGRVNEAQMVSLMSLHAASSDLIQRTPPIARAQASNLLRHILQTLSQAQQHAPTTGAIGSPDDKIVFLVGHDTNISNVAALLDAHWLINGYQRDDAAPGGALVFELWQETGRPDAIKVYYEVQSPEQMRNSVPLTTNAPPKRATIFLPGCSLSSHDSACDWKDFQQLLLGQTVRLPGRQGSESE